MENTRRPVAWLLGASSGIGQALAFRLVAAGWRVAIRARRLEPMLEMQAQQPALVPYTLDVTDVQALRRIAMEITRDLGAIELCIFNANAFPAGGRRGCQGHYA